MNTRNNNALRGLLAGALLVLRLASNAHGADISLEEALDTGGFLSFTNTNSVSWVGQTDVTHDGVDAAVSPALSNNSGSMFQTVVTGPGTISYWWKVSCETNDRTAFTINGVEKARIAGEVDWQSRSFAVSAGSQVLRWAYTKNSSLAGGQDRAWVDQVQYTPDSGTGTNGTNVTCTYSLSPTNATFTSDSSTGLVSVTASTGCSWTAVSTNSWLTIGVGTNGSGNGSVLYNLAANPTSNTRSGNLLIAGHYFRVTQAGQPGTSNGPVTLSQALDYEGGPIMWSTFGSASWTGQSAVTHDGIDAAASGAVPASGGDSILQGIVTGPGTLHFWWKVSSEPTNDTLTLYISGIEQERISGEVDWAERTISVPTGGHSLQWRYVKNASLSGGQDHAWVDQVQYIPGSGTGNTNGTNVSCSYVLYPTSATYSSAASSTGLVTVTAPSSCAWTAMTTNSWLTITSGTNGSGDGAVHYSVAANTTSNTRSGNLFIAGRAFSITQTGQAGSTNGPVTLTQALDTEGGPITWSTFGSASWTGQSVVTHDGSDAAASGAVPNSGGDSILQGVVTGPGTLRFWWKVSSEPENDTLGLYISGIEQARISGEVDWVQRTISVPAGGQSLQWRYVKNASLSGGQDRAWVDQVQFTPDVTTNCAVTITPSNRTHPSGTSTGHVDVAVADGCFWSFSNTNPWITTVLGMGYPAFVDYTVAANPGSSSRTGRMTLGTNVFTVIQLGGSNAPCTYTVAPAARNLGYLATSNSIVITTASGCPWSVVNTNPWISFPVNSGSGSTILGYLVTLNVSTFPRSGYVSVANRAVLITQAGTSATNGATNCTIVLSPPSRSHGSLSATGVVTVTTGPGCSWGASETNSWLSLLSVTSGSVTYVIAPNSNATVRTGFINIGGQPFTVTQSGNQPLSSTPVLIPTIEVTNIGHIFFGANGWSVTNGPQNGSLVQDFLIDQGHTSGGGMELPNVSVNWDTNSQFTMTVSAPAGMKFLVEAPAGSQVRFDGYLWWESTRGGFSPAGTASVQFAELEGIASGFSGATPALSSSHGFFGFVDLDGTPVSNRFAFTSMTLSASVVPQFTGNGSENYVPHHESALHLSYVTSLTNDPGPFVSIVPGGPLPFIQMIAALPAGGVDITINGNPGRTHIVQCSTDTVNWTQIASGVMPQSGSMQVRDVNGSTTSAGSHSSSRFYRVVEVSTVLPTD